VTSNPTIFEQAIAGSELYHGALRPLAQAGWAAGDIFYALAIDDIRRAADVFLPLFEQSNGRHGFVSIEVSPKLAYDTQGTLEEARRLWDSVNRPNVMIKIPATREGIPAIEGAIAEGINVNVTLIFSLHRYQEVMEGYLRGLETRLERGETLSPVSSVASFFISRVDAAIDSRLDELIASHEEKAERAAAVRGKAAIANAKLAYAQYKATFADERYLRLAANGARVQRPLWASTSTKDPAFPDTYYVDHLIGPDTVNTLPPNTLDAFSDHGSVDLTLEQGLSAARAQIAAIEALGIKMDQVTSQLEQEGVQKFAASYDQLLQVIGREARRMAKELGPITNEVQAACRRLDEEQILPRLWQGDVSLWADDAKGSQEASQRLGWLTLPEDMRSEMDPISDMADGIREDGFEQIVLLGMGGSSLAPDVFRRVFADKLQVDFLVLDSTDPVYIRGVARKAPVRSSLYIVSSKSGTTTESLKLLEYFWQKARNSVGESAGRHFLAITDPGTPLHTLAQERGFRGIFNADPQVGGRYSALSHFGMVPASIMGLDAAAFLEGGTLMARQCRPEREIVRNPGAYLGVVIGTAAQLGRDKLTLVADPEIEPVADWIEQLIAESTGKHGKGILPIVGEPVGPGKAYPDDRLLIYLRSTGYYDRRLKGWEKAGVPFMVLEIAANELQLGSAFFQWEMATAVAGHVLGVNPFDQPDVQRAKESTAALLAEYDRSGHLPQPAEVWSKAGVQLLSETATGSSFEGGLVKVLETLVASLNPGAPLVILGYLNPNQGLKAGLARMRRSVRDHLGLVSTFGFGPRYLHSTGQYHKGGPSRGIFILLARQVKSDEPIPHESASFGVLEMAQALGDLRALHQSGKQAFLFRFNNEKKVADFLKALSRAAQKLGS
jgi:transaldolase/glucose-6-phosphate isomerase